MTINQKGVDKMGAHNPVQLRAEVYDRLKVCRDRLREETGFSRLTFSDAVSYLLDKEKEAEP